MSTARPFKTRSLSLATSYARGGWGPPSPTPGGASLAPIGRERSSIADDHDALDVLLRDSSPVHRLDQIDGDVVGRAPMHLMRHRKCQVVRLRDEERLNDVLHQAVVLHRSAPLDLEKRPAPAIAQSYTLGGHRVDRLPADGRLDLVPGEAELLADDRPNAAGELSSALAEPGEVVQRTVLARGVSDRACVGELTNRLVGVRDRKASEDAQALADRDRRS